MEYIKNSKLGFVLFAYSWNSCSRLYLYKRKWTKSGLLRMTDLTWTKDLET